MQPSRCMGKPRTWRIHERLSVLVLLLVEDHRHEQRHGRHRKHNLHERPR